LGLQAGDYGRGNGHERGSTLQNRLLVISSNFRFLLTEAAEPSAGG